MDPIRLVVVDDHTLFREGLRALFSAIPDIELVGETANGEASASLVEELQPDVVLMDIDMPEIGGVQAARAILNRNPTVGVVMVTMLEDDASVFSSMRAGARGYVLKGAKPAELIQTIKAVAEGQALFSPAIAKRIMRFFAEHGTKIRNSMPEDAFPELTPRELEVLRMVAQAKRNNEIAETLVISDKTVRNHITSIFSKLQVVDRAQAIIKARDAGLGKT
jgi:DNA-binding NarL/FixJ family response regulator